VDIEKAINLLLISLAPKSGFWKAASVTKSPHHKVDKLGVKRMDDDIKAYFDQRFSQVDQRLVDLEIKLTKRMDDFAVRLEESIRDSQTEILRSI